MGIASVIVVGLIAGLIGRAVMPGKDSMGWIMTILFGIFGSFVGGFLVNLVLNRNVDAGPSGFRQEFFATDWMVVSLKVCS